MLRKIITFLLVVGGTGVASSEEISTFDPMPTISYLESSVAAGNCTPICGNPTCCIAFSQRITTHVVEKKFEDFKAEIGNNNQQMMTITMPGLEQSSLSELGMSPVIDLNAFEAAQQDVMNASAELGAEMACSVCCYSCGSGTCCGACWGY